MSRFSGTVLSNTAHRDMGATTANSVRSRRPSISQVYLIQKAQERQWEAGRQKGFPLTSKEEKQPREGVGLDQIIWSITNAARVPWLAGSCLGPRRDLGRGSPLSFGGTTEWVSAKSPLPMHVPSRLLQAPICQRLVTPWSSSSVPPPTPGVPPATNWTY